jgi:hypothetical protein
MKGLFGLPPFLFQRGVLVLGACLLAAPSATLAQRPPQSAGLISPVRAVLGLSDVTREFGSGFTRSSAAALKRPNGAQVDALLHTSSFTKLYKTWVSGYSVEYSRSTSFSASKVVKSSVELFQGSGSAQQALQATFAARAALDKHAGGSAFTSALVHFSGVGQYAELATNVMKPAKGGKPPTLPGAYQITITFTRGHYEAALHLDSAVKINMSTALAAARLMDSRLHGG